MRWPKKPDNKAASEEKESDRSNLLGLGKPEGAVESMPLWVGQLPVLEYRRTPVATAEISMGNCARTIENST